jgi:hypothetical protein
MPVVAKTKSTSVGGGSVVPAYSSRYHRQQVQAGLRMECLASQQDEPSEVFKLGNRGDSGFTKPIEYVGCEVSIGLNA